MVQARRLFLAIVMVASFASAARTGPPKRYSIDSNDIARMRLHQPQALELFEKGESLLMSGEAQQAAELFRQAAEAAPESALSARRQCQALTELGKRDEAIAACKMAMSREGSPMNMRAMVGALLAGPRQPTVDDFAQATLYTNGIERIMAGQPLAYAAQLDMAWRLGDTKVLEACLAGLRKVAPEHYETRRAEALIASLRPRLWVWLGWAVIVAGSVATLAHALTTRRLASMTSG